MIDGERIKQGRELRGLTQTHLASLVGVNQSAVAQWEARATRPSDATLEQIALALTMSPSFFRRSAPLHFPVGSLLFRAQRSATARDRSRAIAHLVSEVERAGVVVLALPVPLRGQDAFSLWTPESPPVPVLGLTGGASGDRLRFDVAHELGHLVMHLSISGSLVDVEVQAHRFAAELLMPGAAIADEFPSPVTLQSLLLLKSRWGASVQALITRARDVGVISDRRRSYLFQQLSARGWRKREPVSLPMEKPRALRKMAEVAYGGLVDYRRISADSGLPAGLVEDLLAGQAGAEDMRATVVDDRAVDNVVDFRRSR